MEKKKILIIDDDVNINKILSAVLTFKKYEPITAVCGKDGLDRLNEAFVNLVIIDLGLPDMSGLDVLSKVKHDHPNTEAIILTSNSSFDAAVEAANRGAFSYVLKPYKMEQLLLHIQRALEKQAIQEDLRRSERRYRLIAENVRDMIWTLDLSKCTTYVSPSVRSLRGFTPEEAKAQTLAETVSPESAEILAADMQTILQGSQEEPSENMLVNEIEYLCKDGGRIWMEATISGLRDDSGKLLGMLVASHDITERKVAEEEKNKLIFELQESIHKIKTLTGLLPICSYCKKIRNDNDSWEQLETYIKDRSEANFSHSICPECLDKYLLEDE
jgi:PAS domain S-box-containing protein